MQNSNYNSYEQEIKKFQEIILLDTYGKDYIKYNYSQDILWLVGIIKSIFSYCLFLIFICFIILLIQDFGSRNGYISILQDRAILTITGFTIGFGILMIFLSLQFLRKMILYTKFRKYFTAKAKMLYEYERLKKIITERPGETMISLEENEEIRKIIGIIIIINKILLGATISIVKDRTGLHSKEAKIAIDYFLSNEFTCFNRFISDYKNQINLWIESNILKVSQCRLELDFLDEKIKYSGLASNRINSHIKNLEKLRVNL